MRTELVQNATGPGQEASGTVSVAVKAVKSLRWSLRADGDVLGPLRLILTVAHSPTVCTRAPAFTIAYLCSFGLRVRTSASSLACQPVHSLLPPPLSGVSRKMALRPRAYYLLLSPLLFSLR